MTFRGVSALLAAALLGGCVSLPVGTDGLSLEERRSTLESVGAWEMRGRMTVDTGERAFQGSFNWRQQDDALELAVRGPLRNTVLHVAGEPDALTVTARGESRTLTDPESELSELLGWWLPVASLPHWLLGFPDAGFRGETEAGADGTLAALDQRLWHVAYPLYELTALAGKSTGVLLPRRIELTHGALELRLTIDDWQPRASTTTP
jgi:outer membrane lipoprotein LolB